MMLILLIVDLAASDGEQQQQQQEKQDKQQQNRACQDILDFGIGFSSCLIVSQLGMCGGGWGLSGSCPATCGNCE